MLDNFVSPYDATVVAQLEAAGAVMLGKANMDEFAMGSSNETSYYGPVSNPWDTDQGARRLLGRLGGRGGGAPGARSRRVPIPAAPSASRPRSRGVTGIKPTYGRVSRYGMIAFASSLDQAGVARAHRRRMRRRCCEVMAGFDPRIRPASTRRCPTTAATLERAAAAVCASACCASSSTGWTPATRRSSTRR